MWNTSECLFAASAVRGGKCPLCGAALEGFLLRSRRGGIYEGGGECAGCNRSWRANDAGELWGEGDLTEVWAVLRTGVVPD
jgi:hypothetical protein